MTGPTPQPSAHCGLHKMSIAGLRRNSEKFAVALIAILSIMSCGVSGVFLTLVGYTEAAQRRAAWLEYGTSLFQNMATELVGVIIIFAIYKILFGLWEDKIEENVERVMIDAPSSSQTSRDNEIWKKALQESLLTLIAAGKIDRQSLQVFGESIDGVRLLSREEIRDLQQEADRKAGY